MRVSNGLLQAPARRLYRAAALGIFLLGVGNATAATGPDEIQLRLLGTYHSGVFDESAAEISAYDAGSQRLFVVNANDVSVDILDLSAPSAPSLVRQIDIAALGGGANSVAVHDGLVAVAVEAETVDGNGKVVFMDIDGQVINQVTVGVLPDMLTFTPDGTKVLIANEGQPNDDYTVDPEGSVSIIDLDDGVAAASATTVRFTAFTDAAALRAQGIRVFGPNATPAQDFEPEYIAVAPDGKTAYVGLQENNAIAVVDIEAAAVTALWPLGFKDHSLPQNAFDASNRDNAVNIRSWPTFGMYQPDAMTAYEAGGRTYIVTANEGDSRDYDGFSEEERVGDLTLDPTAFPNAADLQQDANLGRLKTTTTLGDLDGDGDFDRIYSYGARSFTIWSDQGELVFDSGDDFERITAGLIGDDFNSSNDENSGFDDRSDDKGPEPEAVAIGHLAGRIFAFIGLERVGGIMVYDVTNPWRSHFVTYVNSRDFGVDFDPDAVSVADLEAVGDLGPEGLVFIDADASPNGQPLLVVSSEVSGSVSVYEIATRRTPVVADGNLTRRLKSSAVVHASFTDLGTPLAGTSVELWRGDDRWQGLTDADGNLTFALEVAGRRAGASGYYQARAFDADGAATHQWHSIPLNGGKETWLVLPTGDMPFVVEQRPLPAAKAAADESAFALEGNSPNPFNPETQISFRLGAAGIVKLAVYNALGQQVRVLADGFRAAGTYKALWDGRDAAGEQVSSGVYFYRLEHAQGVETRRMTLLK